MERCLEPISAGIVEVLNFLAFLATTKRRHTGQSVAIDAASAGHEKIDGEANGGTCIGV